MENGNATAETNNFEEEFNDWNKDIDSRLRGLFWQYYKVRHIKNKTERKAKFEEWQDDIKTARRHLRSATKGKYYTTVFYNDECYDSWLNIYKEPVEWDGTKEELDKALWEEQATIISCAYDCTGQVFTSHFRIAHMRGNLWKVAEAMGLDV